MHILVKMERDVERLYCKFFLSSRVTQELFFLYILTSNNILQRGEAKLLVEDWEGAVADIKSAAEKSPQVCYFTPVFYFIYTGTIYGHISSTVRK